MIFKYTSIESQKIESYKKELKTKVEKGADDLKRK